MKNIKKSSKYVIALILVVAMLTICLIPFPQNIAIHSFATEYSLNNIGIAIPHEIVIDGTYYTRVIGKDRFIGKFYISETKGITEGMQADFWFEPGDRYHPMLKNSSGEPISTEIGLLLFTKGFAKLAFQMCSEYDNVENIISYAYDDNSNFIVLGEVNREDALSIYLDLLNESKH